MVSRRLSAALVGAAVWTALLLIFATQYYVALRTAGQPVTWFSQLRRELPGWAMWAVISPLIFYAAGNLPLVEGSRTRNALLHLPVAAGVFVLYLVLYNAVIEALPLRPDVTASDLGFGERFLLSAQLNFATFCLIYLGALAVSYMLAYQRALRDRELEAARLRGSLTQARLDALRMQLQPHFLFNTLHGISALMEDSAKEARRMMTRLSDLLRFAIETSDEFVPLGKELAMLRRYLEIQEMRFGDRLSWSVDVPPDCLTESVPRFLLQPLVENAIHHGMATRSEPGSLTVRGSCTASALRLVVEDDGPGFPPEDRLVEGVGMANTRARLEALYRGRSTFNLGGRPTGGAQVVIELPREKAA